MKKIVILIFLLFSVQITYASELDNLNLSTQAINPGDFYYLPVRLWEKIAERFKFSDNSKFNYSNSLIDKRMSELGFVVKNRRLAEVQKSSERLAYQVGTLTELLIKEGDTPKKEQLKKKIDSFSPALVELRDYFPANTSFWMLVSHDINALKEYSEKLSK